MAPLLCYTKLFASFQIHHCIQTGVTLRKRSNRVKIWDFLVPCDLKIWWMTLKIIRHLFYAMLNFVRYIKVIGEFKVELQSRNAQFWWKSALFVPCDLEIWRMTLKSKRAPILCCFKLGHHFIVISEFKLKLQSGNAQFVSKSMIFKPCDLEIWRMTLKNNRAHILCYFKLCASNF